MILAICLSTLQNFLCNLSLSATFLMSRYIFASSANRYILIFSSHTSTKSFVNIINKSGPIIEPCGIPLRTFAQHENLPLTLTLCLQSVKKIFDPFYYSTIVL